MTKLTIHNFPVPSHCTRESTSLHSFMLTIRVNFRCVLTVPTRELECHVNLLQTVHTWLLSYPFACFRHLYKRIISLFVLFSANYDALFNNCMQTKFWRYVRLTLLVSSENPDLNVSQREDSDGLWDAFLQLVLYSCGTQELDTRVDRNTHKSQLS